MRILYAVSLFSGLRESIRSGSWEPTGAPTIYKMIEGLEAAGEEIDVVFSAKDADDDRRGNGARRLQLRGLRSSVWILPYWSVGAFKALGLGRVINELRHAIFLLNLYRRRRFDVFYFNNGNLLTAALFAYMGIGRVVLRIMGVYPVMKRIALSPRGVREKVERLAYRAPFHHVICSQDGSGGEWFLDRALRRDVPRDIWINGVDWRDGKGTCRAPILKEQLRLESDKALILFVGKFEHAKGCREFLDGIIRLGRLRGGAFQAVMIGRGPEMDALRRTIAEHGLEGSVKMFPHVAHKDIWMWYQAADIYVSLNRLGGLSNANLEAMGCGVSMVMLCSDKENHIDEVTEQLLGDDCVVRIQRDNIVDNLVNALLALLDAPETRKAKARRIREVASDLIPSWENRIDKEIQFLRRVAGANGRAGFQPPGTDAMPR